MEFFDAIRQRHSVRTFLREPIPPEGLQRILEAANLAPSAGDLQAYEIYQVQDPGTQEALAVAAYDQAFIEEAPLALIFVASPFRARRYGERGASLYSIQDATIAAAYVQLAAVSVGLASCWVGAFDEAKVASILHLPAGQKPIAILPIGKPGESPAPTPRRELTDLVRRV
jgi:nitroreductase